MKNKIIALCLTAVLLLPLLSCVGGTGEELTLMIANDLHFISPSLLGDGEFFRNPQSRADGKLVHYSPEITDAFIAEVIKQKPQALILAGDLTLNGAKASHQELAEKLMQIKDAGIDLLIIPGNHDFDKTAVDYSGETLKEADAASAAYFHELYDPLIPETLSREGDTFNYIYEASEPVKFEIANVSGDNQRPKGAVIVSGSVVITQLTLNNPNRQNSDYSASLNGYGAYAVGA